jgi:hypothetical protein
VIAKAKQLLFFSAPALLLIGWWLSDIPIGYFQFKNACVLEAGFKQAALLEKNAGWEGQMLSYRGYLAESPHIKFVRIRLPTVGRFPEVVDFTYKGGNPNWDSAYDWKAADESKPVVYRVSLKVENAPGIRLLKTATHIVDVRSGQTVISDTSLTYSFTNPDNSFLGMARRATCPEREFSNDWQKANSTQLRFKE